MQCYSIYKKYLYNHINKIIYLVQGLNRTFTAQPTRHQALRPNTGWNDTHYTISSLRLFRISGRR